MYELPGCIKHSTRYSSVIKIIYKMKEQRPGSIIQSARYPSKIKIKHKIKEQHFR